MVFYMPGQVEARNTGGVDLAPRRIVSELDRHIVGQTAAKRAVAIALRNRMRRQKLDPEMAEGVSWLKLNQLSPGSRDSLLRKLQFNTDSVHGDSSYKHATQTTP